MESRIISSYTIRLMTYSDINDALGVFASHGLFESASAVRVFMECDPNAFYVAVSNDDQTVIGVCASPVTSHSTGFFGLYGVLKEHQRLGIGSMLFDNCLKHIGHGNSGLFSAENMEQKYENNGFGVKNGVAMVVFEGVPQNLDHLYETIDKNINLIEFNSNKNSNLLNKIILYDTKVQNCLREKLITLTVENSNHYTLVALNSDSNVLGYGCMRTNCMDQQMIGPVYADNASIAEALIISLVKQFRLAKHNKELCLCTLNTSSVCIELCEKMQLKRVANSSVLFTKYSPPISYHLIFCVHCPSFAL